MRNGCQQGTDWMTCSSGTKIIGRHMQINLRARDLSMTEQISNRDKADTGTHQVRGKSVATMSCKT
jgi:hypothetical protein